MLFFIYPWKQHKQMEFDFQLSNQVLRQTLWVRVARSCLVQSGLHGTVPRSLSFYQERKGRRDFSFTKRWTLCCFSFYVFHSCMDQWLNNKHSLLLLSQGGDLEIVYLKWVALLLQLGTQFCFLHSSKSGNPSSVKSSERVLRFLFCF